MRLGLRTTLGISVALHCAVLWALIHWAPKPETKPTPKRPPVPIAFVMPSRSPPVAPPQEAPPQPPKPRARPQAKRRARPAPTPPPPAESPTEQAADAAPTPEQAADAALTPEQPLEPVQPGRRAPIDLFAGVGHAARGVPMPSDPTTGSAAGGPSAPGDPDAALQRATASLEAWKTELRGQRVAAAVPRGVRQFGERLNRTFLPDPNSLRHASPLGTGTLSMVPHYFNTKERDQHSVRATAEKQMGAPLTDRPGGHTARACFGACDGFEHGAARLSVEVVVQHDDAGKPLRWFIPKPSGDRQFDTAALDSVRDAVNTLPPWVDGVPRESHWAFEYQAFRWGRMELLLDPGFQTPGREVDNGVLGKTTVVQAVKLVWLALADPPQGAEDQEETGSRPSE